MEQSTYYYGLDYLRAFAMLLGLVLHSFIAYLTSDIWVIVDGSSSVFADVVFEFIHSFRMQLFFVLSGFFSALLIKKYQPFGFLKTRFKKVFLPLVLSVFTVIPLSIFLILYLPTLMGYSLDTQPATLLFIEEANQIRPWVLAPIFSVHLFVHLWFLWCLCGMSILHFVMFKLTHRIFENSSLPKRTLLTLKFIILFTLIIFTHQYMNLSRPLIGADTSAGILPLPYVFFYYFSFYMIGSMIFNNNLMAHIQKINTKLAVFFIIFCLFIAFPMILFIVNQASLFSLFTATLLSSVTQLLYLILFITALLAFSFSINTKYNALMYLAQSSYFVYIIHLPVILILQYAISPIEISVYLKMLIVLFSSAFICFTLYHFMVKDKWLGRLLGERKY